METVTIKVGQHYKAIIDAEDLPKVSQHTWYPRISRSRKTVYAYTQLRRRENGKRIITNIHLHRVILEAPDGFEIDHKDRNGLNCSKCNLRIATRSQNCANRVQCIKSKTEYVGVFTRRGRFHGVVWCNNRRFGSGEYDNPIEAARARDKKAHELFGEFAVLNFPDLIDAPLRPPARPGTTSPRFSDTSRKALWLLQNQHLWRGITDQQLAAQQIRAGLACVGLLSPNTRWRDLNPNLWIEEAERLMRDSK